MAKYKGEFWLKGEEDKTYLGEIKLGKRSSELNLIIPAAKEFDRGRFLQSDPLRPVLGFTTCGKTITLIDYFQVSFPYSFGRPRTAKFCINQAFTGLPAEAASCDPEVEAASITSKPLAEWFGKTAIKKTAEEIWSAKYDAPESIEIYKGTDYTATIEFGITGESSRTSFSIADNPRIELTAERPLPWSRAFTALSNILDAVSIGCGSYCRIYHAYASSSSDPIYVADFHFHSLFRSHKDPSFVEWFFTLKDLPDTAFAKWMEKAEELKHARSLFFSAKHDKMFVETRAGLLTQAVEVFYRRVHRADDFDLEAALKDLCSEHSDPISVVFSDIESRVKAAVHYVNATTHHPFMVADAMTSGDKLAVEYFLQLLLEICFMSQLDIPTARITGLVESSHKYRQLKELYRQG